MSVLFLVSALFAAAAFATPLVIRLVAPRFGRRE